MNEWNASFVSGVKIPGSKMVIPVYVGVPNAEVDYFEPTRGWLHAEDCLDSTRLANYFKNRMKILRVRYPDDLEDSQLLECYELMMPAFDRGANIYEPVFLAYVKGSPEQTSEQAQLLRGMLPKGAQVGVAIGDGHNLNQVSEFMEWADANEFSPLVIGSKLYPYRHVVLPRLPYKESGWYHIHDPFAHELDVGALVRAKGRLSCSWIVS